MATGRYRSLKVWRMGMDMTKQAYASSKQFPKDELYGLTSQLWRAAVSVPANIAEGHARGSTKEFLRHLSIAQGSLAEVETLLTLAEELGYCRPQELAGIVDLCGQLGRMIGALRNRLRSRLDR